MAARAGRTFERPNRLLGVRIYNVLAGSLERCSLGLSPLTEESILDAARRQTRLTDFGGEAFRIPLRQLLKSLQEDAHLHAFGRMVLRRSLIDHAANRLKIQDDLKRHPEILDQPIHRPLFVTGLPRTGTTLLYNLLSQDPQSRPMLTWESFWPSPPPEATTRTSDPRIKEAQEAVNRIYRFAPELRAVHSLTADGPSECIPLMFNTFISPAFSMLANLRGYEDWLAELDFEARVAAFEDYRRQLQLLQWRCSAHHWVLKQPAHLPALDALMHVFPDCCIVQSHRDPARVIPSVCSLFSILRGIFSDHVDPYALGARALDMCVRVLDRGMAGREAGPDHVFDVRYDELMRDPIGTVHGIYEHFGYECSDRMDASMKRHLAQHPRHKGGVHRYDLAQFGLDQATVDRVFKPYCDRFGIPRELPSDAEQSAGARCP